MLTLNYSEKGKKRKRKRRIGKGRNIYTLFRRPDKSFKQALNSSEKVIQEREGRGRQEQEKGRIFITV